jgi:hypothetical protein
VGTPSNPDPSRLAVADLLDRLVCVDVTKPEFRTTVGGGEGKGGHAHDAARAFDALRTSLVKAVGPDGFAALLRRAVATARKDRVSFQRLRITADDRVEGLESLSADDAALLARRLYELLVLFLGEPIALAVIYAAVPQDESPSPTRRPSPPKEAQPKKRGD